MRPQFPSGPANRAAAKSLGAIPRPTLIDTMSRLTASLYDLPHAEVHGEE